MDKSVVTFRFKTSKSSVTKFKRTGPVKKRSAGDAFMMCDRVETEGANNLGKVLF